MAMNDEQRRKRIELGVKLGLIGVAGFIIAPFVMMAIGGLIGAAIAAALGYGIVMFAPVFAMKVANWRLGAIKYEARTNPIETLQNQYTEKQEALGRFRDSIKQFRTSVLDFEQKVEVFSASQPEEAERFQQQLATMRKLLEYRESRYKNAKGELEAFDVTIHKASALWDMSLAAAQMNKLAGMQTGDPFDKIKTETALDSVQSSLNATFAELEDALLDTDEVSQKALAYKPSTAIPMTVPSTVKARLE